MDEMTVAKFKEELPLLVVKYAGRRYTGRPTGRLNRFCSVALCHDGHKAIMGPIIEFAWETVTSAYNRNAVLRAD